MFSGARCWAMSLRTPTRAASSDAVSEGLDEALKLAALITQVCVPCVEKKTFAINPGLEHRAC
jgi:hypothetical protein